MAKRDSTGARNVKPSADEIRAAETAIRKQFAKEPELDDFVQDVLAEAVLNWNGSAKVLTYAVTLAVHRAKDRGNARAREAVAKLDPRAGFQGNDYVPKNASAELAREVQKIVEADIEGLIFPRELPELEVAAYIRLSEIEPLLEEHGAHLKECSTRGMPLRVPQDFDVSLARYIQNVARTNDGAWIESADSSPAPRRGKPRAKLPDSGSGNTIAYEWMERREDLCRAIMRYALGLCGLSGADLNRITSSVRKAEADRKAAAILAGRLARAAIESPSPVEAPWVVRTVARKIRKHLR